MDTFLIFIACAAAYFSILYLMGLGLWALCTKTP